LLMNKRAKQFWSSLLLAGLAVCASRAQDLQPATLSELQQRLAEYVAQPKYSAAMWGVKIVSLQTGKTLFEHNAGKLFSPASNSKLYTVALALDRFGPDYEIKTSLYSAARPNSRGTLKGDLIVFGRGDPTINARLHGGDVFEALKPLARTLTHSGVKRITGDLVADQSYFRGPEFGSGWTWDDLQYYYGAEISALTINDNTVQVTVQPGNVRGARCTLTLSPPATCVTLSNRTQTTEERTKRRIEFYRPLNENIIYVSGVMPLDAPAYSEDVTLHNPAACFGVLLREALRREGIRLSGRVRTVGWLDRPVSPIDCGKLVELGSIVSLPMRDIAREVQKPSQNLYADLLLAHIGENARGESDSPDAASEELGRRELQKFLEAAGIDGNDVQLEEGSGLSRNNLTTPNATVKLLDYMSRHRCAGEYLAALPVAGVDGTLRNRMKNTPAAGNLRAKTGTLRWANSLSGYVTTAAGERLAFCLMLNRYRNPTGTSSRGDLDAIAVLLAGFPGRSGT